MITVPHGLVNWFFLSLYCLGAIMFLAEAWVNIINQKVSKFSIDAFLLFLAQRIGTRQMRKNAKAFPKNKWDIIFVGIWVLLGGIGAIQEIVIWFNKYRLP